MDRRNGIERVGRTRVKLGRSWGSTRDMPRTRVKRGTNAGEDQEMKALSRCPGHAGTLESTRLDEVSIEYGQR